MIRFHNRPPNVTDGNLIDRMRLVEGEDFGSDVDPEYAILDEKTRLPVAEAYAEWCRRNRDPAALRSRRIMTDIVIYGRDRWHVYGVCGDGTVVLSSRGARPEVQARARVAGFEVR